MVRILFLGENWFGSCARACCYALRRLGCDVTDVDSQTFFPQLKSRSSRLAVRAFSRRLVREYNNRVLAAAEQCQPDLLLAFKAPFVRAETLRSLRTRGVVLCNFYPDTSAFSHGPWLPAALPEYDCVFYTKKFWARDVRKRINLLSSVFLPHGYDPELHFPLSLDAADIRHFACDVAVIATHTRHKQKLLEELVSRKPSLDLAVYGNGWSSSGAVGRAWRGGALIGTSYAKAIQAAKINLAILSGSVAGASQGDETTTRTYEIPACGGFMLHQRSAELLELFEEGREVACFGSVEELADKIDFFLANPAERERIAAAGFARCVPAYSYDRRMATIVQWYREQRFPSNTASDAHTRADDKAVRAEC